MNVEDFKAERRRQEKLFWLCFRFCLKFKVKMNKNRGLDQKFVNTIKDSVTVSQSWMAPRYEMEAGELIMFTLRKHQNYKEFSKKYLRMHNRITFI